MLKQVVSRDALITAIRASFDALNLISVGASPNINPLLCRLDEILKIEGEEAGG